MNLILDIGNTRTKVGIFDGDTLLQRDVWEDWTLDDLQNFMATYPLIQRIGVSTVTTIWNEVADFLKAHFYYLELTHETPIPITNQYETPQTLGKDRLASVVAAYALYPDQACLVIDAGTCIKYDIILQDGTYLGGNIAPGVRMRLRAMHQQTARLPEVPPSDDLLDLVGTNTQTALQTGGQLGATLEMKAFIEAYRHKFGALTIILTGGDANYFVKALKTQIFVHPNLVLIGLNKILNYNVQLQK